MRSIEFWESGLKSGTPRDKRVCVGGGGGNTYIGTWEIAGRKIGLERVGVGGKSGIWESGRWGEVRNQGEWALGGSQESGRVGVVGKSGIRESGRWGEVRNQGEWALGGSQESGRVGVGEVRNLGEWGLGIQESGRVGVGEVRNLGEWGLGESGIWETWGLGES